MIKKKHTHTNEQGKNEKKKDLPMAVKEASCVTVQ